MPSKTPKQAKLMRAIAHGWTPSRMESPPSRAVAQEFVEADRKYSGGFAENRYWTGGLAAMDEVNSGIDETLNWLKGGHVNYYEEGGDVRPGHPEGPNPFEGRGMPASYARWERENHTEAPPPPPPKVEPEKLSMWETLMSYARGPGQSGEDLEELEAETGEAHGGRVRYQTGGLAIAAPAGGVPPWISPVAADPGYMQPPGYAEEPQGYQFGGMASRMGPAMRMARGIRGGGGQYRGVPPQRGGIQRGAPPGGRGFRSRFGQQQQRVAPRGGSVLSRFVQQANERPGGGQPQGGGLAAMMRQMQQQRAQQGPDPHQGRTGPGGVGLDPYSEGELSRRGPRGPFAPGGGRGPIQIPIMDRPNPNIGRPGYDPIGDMGPIYNRPGPIPTRFGGAGKPRPGPGMIPPAGDEGGGGIPGGPRVPPNQRGYLQRQRMMNRPPANVGGGANRVGMQDQQGGLSRALQRGTGRPPMSRRFGQGRAGPTR